MSSHKEQLLDKQPSGKKALSRLPQDFYLVLVVVVDFCLFVWGGADFFSPYSMLVPWCGCFNLLGS